MFAKLWNDESGASAAEYALILAIVGSAIALSVTNLGTDISEVLDRAGDRMDATLPAAP
jgi:pilus assembly protein Flp/PilA